MRFLIQHITSFAYERPVELAVHLLHLRPRERPNQRVLEFDMFVAPDPDRLQWGTDHFGNPVGWMFLDHPHPTLRVGNRALVDVTAPETPPPGATPAWEHVVGAAKRPEVATDVAEFTFGSPMAPIEPASLAYAAPSFPPGRPILAGLLDLMARIDRDFRFDPEVTTVSTPVDRVLQLRAGVCQDFAHVMIAGLRGLGLPARYVSGYVRTASPEGMPRLRGADQSHAWVGCWLGPAHGWLDLDPTNDLLVADGHVTMGWGRDYGDVSPIRGVLLGGGNHSVLVSVDMAEAESLGEMNFEPSGNEV